jgi:hypothetical protein
MARKSPDIANPFASTQAQQPESTPSRKREGTKAATFYFRPDTLARLHAAWARAVAEDPQATKSGMVEAAVLAFLEGIGEG